ncbi:hypothetical protein L596_027352 [Steinernema carpocapsae]|uniref:Uncharacterized protein n=1 Tax=Steinernema carpocapsae TaxID=34508 RepID=A0A4U5M429_STECR|nr:hypothetical protein L596_027352 [Steinernema carpocapsae]
MPRASRKLKSAQPQPVINQIYVLNYCGPAPRPTPTQITPNYSMVNKYQQEMTAIRQWVANQDPSNAMAINVALTQVSQDPLFRLCTWITGCGPYICTQTVFLKNSLNEMLPYMTEEVRGEITDFQCYFMKIATEVYQTGKDSNELVSKTIAIFNTVVKECEKIEACKPMLKRIYLRSPQYFDAKDWAT